MKISTKGQYAVRFMVELAKTNEVVSISKIAELQEISVKYLEQIVSLLCKAKLIESVRGNKGGYKLTKKPESINIKEILETTGDTCALTPCVHGNCERSHKCQAMSVWNNLGFLIDDYLSKVFLSDLLK